MALDQRLVAKGRGEPRGALAQEGKVHVALAKQYAVELEDAGWPVGDTKDLEDNVALVDVAMGSQSEAWEGASGATSEEQAQIDKSKAFIRRLRNALPRALRESPGAGVTVKSFEVGETLDRSTPRISSYLSKIRPSVVKLDGALAKAFKGQNASEVLDKVKAALDGADTAQEVALKNAPDHTLALYEAMGKVLEQIEDMNRAAKTAFDGDAKTTAKFNKDILLRGRKAAKKAQEEEGDGEEGEDGSEGEGEEEAPAEEAKGADEAPAKDAKTEGEAPSVSSAAKGKGDGNGDGKAPAASAKSKGDGEAPAAKAKKGTG